MPHSLHGYFLRPGQPDHPVIFSVDRDRDGGSFSARHVRAIQHGEVIFSMLASFKVPEDATTFERRPDRSAAARRARAERLGRPRRDPRRHADASIHGHTVTDCLWCRVATPLPDDPLLHACVLTYLSDYGGGFVLLDVPGLPLGGPSIDHVALVPPAGRGSTTGSSSTSSPERASDARGTYLGTLRSRDGTLAAVLGQECLLRWPKGAQP